MMGERSRGLSDETRREAGLSRTDLWLRYFELGGMGTPSQLTSYLMNETAPSSYEHDLLAHALNERFTELGRNHPVPYMGAD